MQHVHGHAHPRCQKSMPLLWLRFMSTWRVYWRVKHVSRSDGLRLPAVFCCHQADRTPAFLIHIFRCRIVRYASFAAVSVVPCSTHLPFRCRSGPILRNASALCPRWPSWGPCLIQDHPGWLLALLLDRDLSLQSYSSWVTSVFGISSDTSAQYYTTGYLIHHWIVS